MPTFGQGAPGVRIRLRDASAVNLVINPNITAGVVGYSSKGELNKIIDLTSTADQDTILGSGYNNPRFNQGLYAARSIINAGGYVEYVRPYGEDVIEDKDDPDYNRNQELKTDTFLVEYDFSDSTAVGFDSSFSIDHYASTRYIVDGMAGKGSRKIHNIAETLVEHTNVDFEVDAPAQTDASGGTDKVALFALMNSDPTAANRAGDRFKISQITGTGTVATVTTSSPHGFSVGDAVNITGTDTYNETNVIVLSTGLTVTTFQYTSTNTATETDGAVFRNEDGTESGVDYINIKTVATGKATKKYDYLEITGGSNVILPKPAVTYAPAIGTSITVGDNTSNKLFSVGDTVRLDSTGTMPAPALAGTDYIVKTATITGSGDTITIYAAGDETETDITFTDVGTGDVTVTNIQRFIFVNSSNEETVLEFIDVANGDSVSDVDNISVDIVNDTFTAALSDFNFTVNDGNKFLVGDSVTLTGLSTELNDITSGTDYLVSVINSNVITLVENNGFATAVTIANDDVTGTIVNQTAILRNIRDGLVDIGYAVSSNAKTSFDGSLVTTSLIKLPLSGASNFSVNDSVILSNYEDVTSGTVTLPIGITAGTIYKIATVDLANDTISLKTTAGASVVMSSTPTGTFTILNLTDAKNSVSLSNGYKNLRLDIVGTFSIGVPSDIQDTMPSFVNTNALGALSIPGDMALSTSPEKTIGSTTDGIVLDDSIGRTFLSLGLAVEDYQDVDFDGDQERVFTLTSEGESVARIYLFVEYFFAGELYSFSGTIIPYVFGDLNLDIKEQADNVSNGWKFVLNENMSLENAILDPNFDLSQSVDNGAVTSDFVQVAFNASDPAIVYDAIWEYDPRKNNGSAMLGNAWQLFLDKDVARADMLVAAGTAISNLFVKNLEQINFNVMDAILGICEKRKDLFAIFDGVDEAKVTNALKKMVGIGSQGDLARWGALFDGRSIFFDSVYTKLNAEAVKSIEVATIITLNRAGNVYWLPPAGYETGRIPAALSRRQKYTRTYNYADDPTSDIARLYDANINPTRVNDQGQFIYGQKTMLKRLTALNRLNVIMLVAGIHKRFADFLDRKVFQLNTSALRNGITAELQAQLDLIKSANPAGLTEGICICDDTNNPTEITDTNQLIVDIFLQPTRTSEFITLRTTVQRTGDTATIVSAQLIGG